jgi:hypothetical protein
VAARRVEGRCSGVHWNGPEPCQGHRLLSSSPSTANGIHALGTHVPDDPNSARFYWHGSCRLSKMDQAIAFGCSIFFTGFIAWTYCRRSYMCGFLAALSILFSRDMIEIHSQALSEPPFIAFVLASMVALLSYVESEKTKHRDFGGAPDSVRGRLSFNCGLRHHSSCLAGSEATVHSFDRFCFCFDDRGPSFRRLDHP